MIQLITLDHYGQFLDELAAMHRLRYRVFKERLNWDVQISGGMEFDEFDVINPSYLLQRSQAGNVQGCVRLLPSIGSTMLRDTFRVLLDGLPAPRNNTVWESSRFALDLEANAPIAKCGLACATFELFAGMIEFGLSRQLSSIVTVTDARMERVLRRAGWPLQRIGQAHSLGNTSAVAGYLEVSTGVLARVRAMGGLDGPVLWAPVPRPGGSLQSTSKPYLPSE